MNKLYREIDRDAHFCEVYRNIHNLLLDTSHYTAGIELYIGNKSIKKYRLSRDRNIIEDIIKKVRNKLEYPKFDYKYESEKIGEILILYFRENEFSQFIEKKW